MQSCSGLTKCFFQNNKISVARSDNGCGLNTILLKIFHLSINGSSTNSTGYEKQMLILKIREWHLNKFRWVTQWTNNIGKTFANFMLNNFTCRKTDGLYNKINGSLIAGIVANCKRNTLSMNIIYYN